MLNLNGLCIGLVNLVILRLTAGELIELNYSYYRSAFKIRYTYEFRIV